MRFRGARSVSALLAAALVSACGGGGSGPSAAVPATGASYFPVDAGSRWVYTSTGAASPTIVSRSGTQTVAGQTGQVFSTVDGFDGSTWTEVYVVSDSGVRDYIPGAADPISQALDGLQIMVFPIEVGAVYRQADVTVDSGVDFDGDGRSDSIRLQLTLTVLGFESVSTSAGTFPAALHQRQVIVETLLPSSGLAPVDARLEIDSWYADGVGLVKSITGVSANGARTTSTDALTGYRVGVLSSDRTAPTVLSVLPAAATVVRAAFATVSATMSEAIDPQSVSASTFVVSDAGNRSVAGTMQVSGSGVVFSPAQPWASGTYSVRMTTGIQDLVGNPLSADRSWSFTVDANGPDLLSIVPAAGAKDVALDTSIVIVFSEAPDPATIDTVTVRALIAGTNVAASRTLVGTTLTVTPAAPLAPGTLYLVSLGGVTDLAGNPMVSGADLPQFQTTQGRFAYPVPIGSPSSGVFVAHAIGDVNGDGMADLLVAVTATGNPANDGLYVLKGLPDGTLAPAAKIDTGTRGCYVGTIAIGDLDGDGRPDVAVGGDYCGVQILHQAADGTLVVAEFLDRVTSAILVVADIDGSGKNALVGVGGGLGSVTIWRADGTGTLGFSQSVPIGSGLARDVAIGDVNGDGLPDIVVAQSGFAGQDIAVLLQQAGGTFAAPALLSTGSVWGATAIAIADLNGDGRQDVVASTGGNSPTFIAVFYQGASGLLASVTPIPTYDIPAALRIADIDGDGRPDVVVAHSGWNAVGIYLQRADGTLAPEVRFNAPYGGASPADLAVGDIDRDGRPDIAMAGSIIRQLPPSPASMGGGGASRAASLAAVRAARRAAAFAAGK